MSFGHILFKKLKNSNQKMKGLLFPFQKTSENALEEEQIGEGTKFSSLEAEKTRFWRRSAILCLNSNSII